MKRFSPHNHNSLKGQKSWSLMINFFDRFFLYNKKI